MLLCLELSLQILMISTENSKMYEKIKLSIQQDRIRRIDALPRCHMR